MVVVVAADVDCGCGWESRRNEVSENWDNRKNRNRRGGSCRIGGCSSDDGAVGYNYYDCCCFGFGGGFGGGFGDDDSVWEVVMMWWMMKRRMKRWRRQRRVTVESRVRIVQRNRWIGPPVGRIRNRPLSVVLF